MAARKRKPKHDLASEDDPRAPLDAAAFLAAAKPVLATLTKDLLERADTSPNVTATLKQRHAHDVETQRTADGYPEWRRAFVDQVAAAWLLSCVFARALEDHGLVSRARIAGPGALDSERIFRQLAPSLGERDYLLAVFREHSRLPAVRDLFDARHNPVWLLGPSAEAARALLALFRAPQPEAPSFRFGNPDTRFLGDLYQDLNEDVKKRYALLQTPRFVEEFILDRTLDRAIERFGLADATLIDPTSGSGHFLLGAFERLFRRRLEAEPGLGEREAARLALDAVYGADINPYAVAIARFRLTLAFLDKAGFERLDQAPALPLHVAVADSLLHNPQLAQAEFKNLEGQRAEAWSGQEFALEDEPAARDVLHRQYAAVVGNPPYITVKDAVLRKRYALLYPSCLMNYALTIPFAERFFQLGKNGAAVGMITANSFMKREFGKKLIEEYLPGLNLDLIINTSGAYIPGHGTPTVLLFGTNEPPQGTQVHTLLASRGEPSTPDDPEQGSVWRSIADHWNETGFENEYVTVADVERASLAKHPWSLGGGGAAELKEHLEERAEIRLKDAVYDIGFSIIIGEDEVFIRPHAHRPAAGLPMLPLVIGEEVRDWGLTTSLDILRPFHPDSLEVEASAELRMALWPWRTVLENRIVSGSTSMKAAKRNWFDVRRLSRDKHRWPLAITFAFVATHNHFVLDRGGKVFNRSAPIIKLPEIATEDDHLALLAYLNSSTACFWMKQAMMNKGGSGIGRGVQDEAWESRFEFDGTKLASVPLPAGYKTLAPLGQKIVEHAEALERVMPAAVLAAALARPGGAVPDDFGTPPRDMMQRLVALQEELDWAVYRMFGLLPDKDAKLDHELSAHVFGDVAAMDPRHDAQWPGELAAGHRPFEQLLDPGSTQWFARNGYALPQGVDDYGTKYGELLRNRMRLIEDVPAIRVVEQPEYKRRWTLRDPAREAAAVIRAWALGSLEARFTAGEVRTAGDLVMDWFRTDPELATTVAERYFASDALAWFRAALTQETVPYMAALRFTPSGLDKHRSWAAVWQLQRAEDRGERIDKSPVPPKYAQVDFRAATYWSLRGKLDVPKERFISYPGCESDEDGEPVYGWAGWDHAQRAAALGALYVKRKQEGWDKERLTPMLAGLLELLPWLHQWHAEPDDLGRSPAEDFRDFLDGECREHGFTHDDLRAWRPPEKKGRTKKRVAAAATKT